jgi:hypothetical protein
MSATTLRKINVKQVWESAPDASVKKDFKKIESGKALHVMRVMGEVHGTRTVETQYGESLEFKGMFEAINPVTEEAFRSPNAFLPGIMEDEISADWHAAKENGATSLRFAADVYVSPDENSATSYVYAHKWLMERSTDPFADMKSSMPEIAAPSKTPAIEDKSGETDAKPAKETDKPKDAAKA